MPGLDGQRVVLTRSVEDTASWAAVISAAGASPISLPCIRCEAIAEPELAPALSTALETADWLIFTSRRGVETYVALGAPPIAATTRIAVVGEATAAAARAHCGRADVVGEGTAKALARTVTTHPAFERSDQCVIAVAENAGPALEDVLCAAGAETARFDLYRTLPSEPREPRTPLSTLAADAVIFASPTAVTGFVNQIEIDDDCAFVSIGPSTSTALRNAGLSIAGEAAQPSLDALLAKLAESTHA